MRTALALLALSVAIPSAARERRGAVAFHYGGPLPASEIEWYGRFDVVVTHDPLQPILVDALHARGARVVLYEWSVAFYASRADSWQQRLLHDGRGLLNTRPLRGGSGAADADAYYFDPATREHRVERARAIAEHLRAIHYDGVFLDTTRFENVHPDAASEYTRRHPDVAYDAAFAEFMKTLRAEVKVIITNQGYRDAQHYLPFADYDVTESLITYNGHLRPWIDAGDRWNSIEFVMRTIVAPVMKRYPRVRFVHLNYMANVDGHSVEPVVAIARLFGADAFVALPSISAPPSTGIYFEEPGPAETPIRRAAGGLVAYRRFEHQLVVVNMSPHPFAIGDHKVAAGRAVIIRRHAHS
jgi:hypothetical protein